MSWIKVSIKGRVVDEKGNPVSYAIVKVSKRIGPPYEVRAELDGSFHSWTPPFTAYDKKKIVKVSISKLGYKPVKLDIDVSKCSALEEVDLGEIVLESLPEIATIKGVVFDEKTGKSLRDILVKLKKNGISLDEYVTGNDGMFAFKVVEPGKYEIEASTTELSLIHI